MFTAAALLGVSSTTFTLHVATNFPSFVVTVMFAVPFVTPLTTPSFVTVATDVLSDAHVTDLSAASEGTTVALS